MAIKNFPEIWYKKYSIGLIFFCMTKGNFNDEIVKPEIDF